MSTEIRTYRHNKTWMTEVTIDKGNSYSRASTAEEIAAIESAEQRDKELIDKAAAEQAELEELRAFKADALAKKK